MTSPVVTISPEAPISEIARLMDVHRLKRLPVVDSNDQLAGIVSRRDLLQVFLQSDEALEHAIRHEVFERVLWISPDVVDVSVSDGVVTLRGTLQQKSLTEIAERLTRGIDGVIDVDSRLTYTLDDTKLAPQPPTESSERLGF